MTASIAIPSPMAKKKKTSDAQGKRETVSVSARINRALFDALELFISETKPEPTTRSVIEHALEKYFAEKGYLPPEEDSV